MVSLNHVEEQLTRIGCNFRFWGRPEIRELCNILVPGEVIAVCVNGQYEGGFALLCATNYRLILIDKRPLFLTLEDIRFDMIAEIDYSAGVLNSTLYLMTPTRKFTFMSWGKYRLRQIADHTQQRLTDMRQQYLQQQFQPQTQTAPVQSELLTATQMALQGAQHSTAIAPLNPYTHGPTLMRNRRPPKFYR